MDAHCLTNDNGGVQSPRSNRHPRSVVTNRLLHIQESHPHFPTLLHSWSQVRSPEISSYPLGATVPAKALHSLLLYIITPLKDATTLRFIHLIGALPRVTVFAGRANS